MKVKALDIGYDNVAVREAGDVFDMPEGAEAPWFEPLDEPAPVARKKAVEQKSVDSLL